MSNWECADVLRLAAVVRGDWRSALSQRGNHNERDAEAVAPGQGPSRSGGRGTWIVSHMGSVPTDAAHQLGMQVPGRRAHAGAASYAQCRGKVRDKVRDGVRDKVREKVRDKVRESERGKVRGFWMRVAILCSSPYSETGCAVTAQLAQLGYVPVGALTLPSWDRGTLSRKFGQWGLHDSLHYAAAKLAPGKSTIRKQVLNPYLEKALRHGDQVCPSLRQRARTLAFPCMPRAIPNSPPPLP